MTTDQYIEKFIERNWAIMIERPFYVGKPDEYQYRLSVFKGENQIMVVEAVTLLGALQSAARRLSLQI